jgi:hypothetical protein
MNLPDLSTLELLGAAWSVCQMARAVGGCLVRFLRPGPGQHRRPRRLRKNV